MWPTLPDSAASVTRELDSALLPSGVYYARLIAILANEPERYFQVSGNKLFVESNTYFGAIQFSVD